MNNTYLLKLEEKIKDQGGIIANFQKEQSASVQLFKDKETEISNLNNSLTTLTSEQEKAKEKLTKLEQKAKETNNQLKETQQELTYLVGERNKAETDIYNQRKSYYEPIIKQERERIMGIKKEMGDLASKYTQLENLSKNQTQRLTETNNQLTAEQEKNQILEDKLQEATNRPESPVLNQGDSLAKEE